jgi:hypothetical protein
MPAGVPAMMAAQFPLTQPVDPAFAVVLLVSLVR